MIVKAGFDPTSRDLHLGHAVLLKKLRSYQDAGHHVVMVVGDFTAKVGDPTGRNQTRPVLSDKDIEENAKTYMEQAFKILDPEKTTVRKNSEWFGQMSAADLLSLAQQFTVQQLLKRNDFEKRMTDETPLGLHEVLYPLLQGYDSVALAADIEVGGDDQLFNLHMGRDMQRHFGKKMQEVTTVPLLVGVDGVKKMSKSLGNHIGLLDTPTDIFGKTMSIPDETIGKWSETLGFLIKSSEPYEQKKELAFSLVAWLTGEQKARAALNEWNERFAKRVFETSETRDIEKGQNVAQILVSIGFCKSMTEAKQNIQSGAVRLNGEKITNYQDIIESGVLSLGRRKLANIRVLSKKLSP